MAADLLSLPVSDDIVVEDWIGNRATVGGLRAYNASIASGEPSEPPLKLGRVEYNYGGELLAGSLVQSSDLILSIVVEPAQPQLLRDPAERADWLGDSLIALQSGRREDLFLLLEEQIARRERDVSRMRRLSYIHHTAVQNAVDIVQSKRIDFLDAKTDTWVEGLWPALFVAVVLTLFPAQALVGSVLVALSKGIVRTFGARAASRAASRARFRLREEVRALEHSLDTLRARPLNRVRQRRQPLSATARAMRREEAPLKDRLSSLKQEIEVINQKQYLDVLVESAAQSAAQRLDEDALADLAKEKAVDALRDVLAPSPQESRGAIPLDVAMKNWVQDLYAPPVFMAEDALNALRIYRAFCASEEPTTEELFELAAILVAADAGSDDLATEMAISAQAALDAYEEIIWILLYGNQVVETWTRESFDSRGHFQQRIAEPSPKYTALLSYLRNRFYPNSGLDDIAFGYQRIYKSILEATGQAQGNNSGSSLDWERFQDSSAIKQIVKEVKLRQFPIQP